MKWRSWLRWSNRRMLDEQQVLAQLEKLLAAEREVKRQQVTLLVRIKNKLTRGTAGKTL